MSNIDESNITKQNTAWKKPFGKAGPDRRQPQERRGNVTWNKFDCNGCTVEQIKKKEAGIGPYLKKLPDIVLKTAFALRVNFLRWQYLGYRATLCNCCYNETG